MKSADLPDVIPVFPLPGALLLPRARLPLHLFEPRYLAMLDDVLKTPDSSREFLDRDRLQMSEGMRFTQRNQRRKLEYWVKTQIARKIQIISQRKVYLGLPQQSEEFGLIRLNLADADVAILLSKTAAQTWQHDLRKGAQTTDGKWATDRTGQRPRQIVECCGLTQHHLRMIQQVAANWGRGETLRVTPNKELYPQFIFQLRDAGRYRGGGHTHLLRCRCDTACLANGDKIFKLTQRIA